MITKQAVSVNFQNHKCQIFTRSIKIAAIGPVRRVDGRIFISKFIEPAKTLTLVLL